MAVIIPKPDELADFLKHGKKHNLWKTTVELANAMLMHLNKEFPKLLIEERRPSESEEVRQYRQKIYESKTSNPPQKVINSLGKIRRSKDWMIKFPNNKDATIIDKETLEAYCTKYFPNYSTIEQWAFKELIKIQATDANAYIAVIPQQLLIPAGDYHRPYPYIFTSEQVIYPPDKGDYCILKSSDKVDIIDDKGNVSYNEGMVFYMINAASVTKYSQATVSMDFNKVELFHNFGEIPVFKINAVLREHKDNSNIQVTRLDPMITELNEAAREYSDLQSVKVQHAHPLFWYIGGHTCDTCKGFGTYPGIEVVPGTEMFTTPERRACQVTCKTCGGHGRVKMNPFNSIEVVPAKIEDQQVPTPPAGYIQKDVESMKFLQASVDGHLLGALSAVNMQFLDQVPLSISGEAKQVDREELNNFVYSFAEDMIWSIDRVIFWICEWRYAAVRVQDPKKRAEMLPDIPVPENFDLLPSEYLMDAIAKAKTAKVSPYLVATMEEEFAAKTFYNKPALAGLLQAVFDLNPLPGISDDEKMIRLSNKGITLEDYVISCNIEQFVKKATKEDKNFMEKDWTEQFPVMVKYAKAKISENTAKQKVIDALNPDPLNVPGGGQPAPGTK